MLNEGYALYKSLERCKIPLLLHHPSIVKLGKSNGLILGLDKNGDIVSLEFRDKRMMTELRTIRDSKKNSFPAMKLKKRLLNFESAYDGEVEAVTGTPSVEKIEMFWRNHGTNQNSVIADWNSVIDKIRGMHLDWSQIGTDGKAYMELLDRMKKLSEKRQEGETSAESRVVAKIVQMFLGALNKGLLDLEEAKEFLFKKDPGTFLFFDVSDYDNYNNRVAGANIWLFISDYLFRMEKSSKEGICALLGREAFLQDDKFPEPSLAKFGPAKVFSMNRDAPCHFRYGNISTDIVPISKVAANQIQSAMEWITHPDREKKTWSMVPSGQVQLRNGKKAFKDDLLLVYLENKPDMNVNKAYLLGGISKDDFSESDFESVAKQVIGAFELGKEIRVSDRLRLFVLRKADKDRRQVVLQKRYSVNEVIASARNWQEAAANIPGISLMFLRRELEKVISGQENAQESVRSALRNKDEKRIYISPRSPFPADLIRLTQRQWIRFGEDSYLACGISLGEVYDMFFARGTEKKDLAENLLRVSLQRTGDLLIGVGNADHKNEITNFNLIKRFTALAAVSALGIYLHKVGILKEEYMRNSLFNVGRFLSLVDTVHFEWCRHVRGGYPEEQNEKKWRNAIPPQLLGNAHFRIALDNPAVAFARLSERLNIYKAWVQKQPPSDGNWAHWAMAEIGRVSLVIQEAIDEGKLPSTTTDIDKTQILLGYLSRSEGKGKTNQVSNP